MGELLGAAAVVASLLYVAQQVRQSNRIAEAEAFRSAQMKLIDLLGTWADDPAWMADFVRIRYQGLRRDQLDAPGRARAGFQLQRMLALYSVIHRDVTLGMLPPAAYEIQAEEIFRTPYMHDVWPILSQDHSREFVAFFEDRFGVKSDRSDSVARVPPGT